MRDSKSPSTQTMGIRIRSIFPYSLDGRWAFDDPRVGLVRHPFAGHANSMMDRLAAGVPGARKGFRLVFSDDWFPCAQATLHWEREVNSRHWYRWVEKGIAGWFDRTLLGYFETPPLEIHVKAEPRWRCVHRSLMDRIGEFVHADNRGAWLMRQLDRYAPIKVPIGTTGRWDILLLPDMPVERLIVAHYDRVDGSPGGNDNSAACIELLTAIENRWSQACTTAVCFTDLEETENCAQFGMQPPAGAEALVKWLATYGRGTPRETLVFDVCGIGTTLSASRPLPGSIVQLVPGRMRLKVEPGLCSDNQAIPGSILLVSLPENFEDALMVFAMMHTNDDSPDLLEAGTIATMTEFISKLIDGIELKPGIQGVDRRAT